MLKITIFVTQFPPKWLGGTEIATYNLAQSLAKRGHDIHIITSHDKGLPNFKEENGFYIYRIAWPRIRIIGTLYFWMKICYITGKIKPDIVHVQSSNNGIPAFLMKKFLKIPYVIWGQGSDVYLQNRFTRIINKLVFPNADSIIALTQDMQKKMNKDYIHEIYIVPNGINLNHFINKSSNSRGKKDTKCILFVGRLHPIKGVQYLIMAMKRVHDEIPGEAMLTIVGDGKERVKLEELSKQLGIQKYVKFVGEIPHEEVHHYMHKANIFVLPSLSEGFPLVILEAMASGLPIIATRVGGIPDIIKDGINGYLVETKDTETIANKIILLLQNDLLQKKISDINYQAVMQYSLDSIVIKLEKIYNLSLN